MHYGGVYSEGSDYHAFVFSYAYHIVKSGEVGDVFDSAAPNIVQGSDLVLKSLWPSLVMDNKWT